MSFAFKRLWQGRRLFLSLAVLLTAALMVRLGFWQLQRRADRQALNARIAHPLAEPPVRLGGPVGDPATLE